MVHQLGYVQQLLKPQPKKKEIVLSTYTQNYIN